MTAKKGLAMLGLVLAAALVVSSPQRETARPASASAAAVLEPPRAETGSLSTYGPPVTFGQKATPTAPALVAALGVKTGGGGDPASTQAFGTWLGRQPTYAVDYTDTGSWSVIADPWSLTTWAAWQAKAPGRVLVLSVPMHPDGAAATWRHNGAIGQYTAYYVELANHLVRAGLSNTVVRLGWEMNISDIGETPADWQEWTAYWRQIVVGMRSVPGQAFRFDWDVQIGHGPDLAQFYPGDDVVDYVGLDAYDVFWDHCDASAADRWNWLLTQHNGLQTQRAFAEAHGKPMSYPEWGLWPEVNHCGGGDDTYYIDQMASWFASNSVAYQSYFDEQSGDTDSRLTGYPLARAEYKVRFGG